MDVSSDHAWVSADGEWVVLDRETTARLLGAANAASATDDAEATDPSIERKASAGRSPTSDRDDAVDVAAKPDAPDALVEGDVAGGASPKDATLDAEAEAPQTDHGIEDSLFPTDPGVDEPEPAAEKVDPWSIDADTDEVEIAARKYEAALAEDAPLSSRPGDTQVPADELDDEPKDDDDEQSIRDEVPNDVSEVFGSPVGPDAGPRPPAIQVPSPLAMGLSADPEPPRASTPRAAASAPQGSAPRTPKQVRVQSEAALPPMILDGEPGEGDDHDATEGLAAKVPVDGTDANGTTNGASNGHGALPPILAGRPSAVPDGDAPVSPPPIRVGTPSAGITIHPTDTGEGASPTPRLASPTLFAEAADDDGDSPRGVIVSMPGAASSQDEEDGPADPDASRKTIAPPPPGGPPRLVLARSPSPKRADPVVDDDEEPAAKVASAAPPPRRPLESTPLAIRPAAPRPSGTQLSVDDAQRLLRMAQMLLVVCILSAGVAIMAVASLWLRPPAPVVVAPGVPTVAATSATTPSTPAVGTVLSTAQAAEAPAPAAEAPPAVTTPTEPSTPKLVGKPDGSGSLSDGSATTTAKKPAPKASATPSTAAKPATTASAPKPAARPKLSPDKAVTAGWNAVESNPKSALSYFQDALSAQPTNIDARYGEGYALLKLGRTAEATKKLCSAMAQAGPGVQREIKGLLGQNSLSCP